MKLKLRFWSFLVTTIFFSINSYAEIMYHYEQSLQCPSNFRKAVFEEVNRDKESICSTIGPWDIYVYATGKIDGGNNIYGYGCNITEGDFTSAGMSICVVAPCTSETDNGSTCKIQDNTRLRNLENSADKVADLLKDYNRVNFSVWNGSWTRNIVLPTTTRNGVVISLLRDSDWKTHLHVNGKSYQPNKGEKITFSYHNGEWIEGVTLDEHRVGFYGKGSTGFPYFIDTKNNKVKYLVKDISLTSLIGFRVMAQRISGNGYLSPLYDVTISENTSLSDLGFSNNYVTRICIYRVDGTLVGGKCVDAYYGHTYNPTYKKPQSYFYEPSTTAYLLLRNEADENDCAYTDLDNGELKFSGCQLKDNNWFAHLGNGVFKSILTGMTFDSSELNTEITFKTLLEINEELDSYAANYNLDGEQSAVFQQQKAREISVFYEEFFINHRLLNKYSENLTISINNVASFSGLDDLIDSDVWKAKFASISSKSIEENYLKGQYINYLLELTKRFYQRIDDKYPEVGFEFLLNNIPDSITEIEDAHYHDWATDIIALAFIKLKTHYPELVNQFDFDIQSARDYLFENRHFLGQATIPSNYKQVFENFIDKRIYERHFSFVTSKAKDSYQPLYFDIEVESYRATMILVLCYIEHFFGKTVVDQFIATNFSNGIKAHNASVTVYQHISGAYTPNSFVQYMPDIYRAKITRKVYEHFSDSSSAMQDLILTEQSGISLAYKSFPVFESIAAKQLSEAKKSALRSLNYVSDDGFLKLLNFLFTFDMLFGVANLLTGSFESAIDDLSTSFGQSEVDQFENELKNITDETFETEGVNRIMCIL